MVERTLPGNPPVSVTLRRSARARRFSLRVSRLDGRVTLSLPARASEAEALAFAGGKVDWVRSVLATSAPRRSVEPGAVVPFEGRRLTVVAASVRAVRIEGDLLLVPGDPARVATRIAAFLKLAARQRLQAESERFAAGIGRPIRAITLRDTRSRWGSCTHDGRLMYSWRLIMAPPEVLSYVAAHEVAHLRELNHSADFWAIVARMMPDYARHRRWLRSHGNELHRIDFGGSD